MKKLLVLIVISIMALCAGCAGRELKPTETDKPLKLPTQGPIEPHENSGKPGDSGMPTDQTLTPTATPTDILTPTPIEPDPYNIDWWLFEYGTDDEILTREQIQEFNIKEFEKGIGLTTISKIQSVKGAEVEQMILALGFPSKNMLNGQALTASAKDAILSNRNLDNIEETVSIRYAIATENTDIRSFPTDAFLSDDTGRYDYFQEDGLNYCEPMIVLHESADREWCFIRCYDYAGWVRRSDIGFCDKNTYDYTVGAYYRGQVWCALKNGDVCFRCMDTTVTKYLRMGTYIVCMNRDLYLAERDTEGNVIYAKADLPENAYAGFLKYTSSNFYKLVKNALGTPYSWGDSEETGMDCSSTVQAIFRCFGMFLPRNSSQQQKTEGTATDVSALDNAAKSKYIMELPVATLLYMPGHVMLYLGEYEGVPYIVHNTTEAARDDGGTDVYNACVITTPDIGKTGKTLLDRVTYTIQIGQ